MKDVQKTKPDFQYPIQRVGISNLTIPISLSMKDGGMQNSVANVNVFVDLKPESKGTHMSRLAIGIQKFMDQQLNQKLLKDIAEYIRLKCEAETCEISYTFPYFLKKLAPISKEPGLAHSNVTFTLIKSKESSIFTMSVETTSTSLCPCSKEISDGQGAHNQRSKITISCQPMEHKWIWIEDLIDIAERNASCEIFSVIKRPDEKAVTQQAYNNPKFVEDIIRGVYHNMINPMNTEWFRIEVRNEESIHYHDAYASIDTRNY